LPRPPDGYLYVMQGAVGFVRFLVDANGQVSGLWYADLAATDGGSATYGAGTFIGTISSTGQLVLQFSAPESNTTVTGTLIPGQSLTLEAPDANGQITNDVYKPASIAQYNQAVAALGH
jgi:hypothetical protein